MQRCTNGGASRSIGAVGPFAHARTLNFGLPSAYAVRVSGMVDFFLESEDGRDIFLLASLRSGYFMIKIEDIHLLFATLNDEWVWAFFGTGFSECNTVELVSVG